VSGPRAAKSATSTPFTDIATLLARAYLRLAKTSRPDDVSRADAASIPLEVSGQESPDHAVEPATRRAS